MSKQIPAVLFIFSTSCSSYHSVQALPGEPSSDHLAYLISELLAPLFGLFLGPFWSLSFWHIFLGTGHFWFVHRICTLSSLSSDQTQPNQLTELRFISVRNPPCIRDMLYISPSAPKREGRLTRFSRSDKNTVKYVRLYSSHLVHMRVPQGRTRGPRLPPVSPQ